MKQNNLSHGIRLAFLLAVQDVKQTYRRSVLGQIWITIGMAVLIASIGLVFGVILGAELNSYLPFLASGIIIFSLMQGVINEGSQSFITAEAMIRQSNTPLIAHHLRVVFRVFFTFAHNIIIFPFVLLFTGNSFRLEATLFPVGLALVLLATSGLGLLFSVVATRFRDIPPIVTAVMTVAFYVSPVIWSPENINDDSVAHFLLGLNPFYHLLQVARLPLLGELPTEINWLLSLAAAAVFGGLGLVALMASRKQIVFWV